MQPTALAICAAIVLAAVSACGREGNPEVARLARPVCAAGEDVHRVITEYYGAYSDRDLDLARSRCFGEMGIWTDSVDLRETLGTCDIPDVSVPGNGRRVHHVIPLEVRTEGQAEELRARCESVDTWHHGRRGAANRWRDAAAPVSDGDESGNRGG